jgi:predicted secreted protein with PEFG-CTERM motif
MQGVVHVGTTGAEKPISPKPELISSDPSMESQVKVNLDHKISGGKVTSMVADGEANSVIINIEAAEQGEITVTLPRNVIDAIRENEDDDFFVLVDYEEVSFEETKTAADRTLSIQFPAGAEIIEIVGTNAIPEFGAITAMILGIAIISVIAISSRAKLSLMPRV